jgi:hypothetical protein
MKQQWNDKERRRKRQIRRILGLRSKRELRLTPGFQSHEGLWAVAKKLPTDFKPYGKRRRSDGPTYEDCCNCRWFHVLAGMRGQDWGVCANPKGPRAGLLTFEHMGCPQYQPDERDDYLETASGKKALKRFQEAEEELLAGRKTKHKARNVVVYRGTHGGTT